MLETSQCCLNNRVRKLDILQSFTGLKIGSSQVCENVLKTSLELHEVILNQRAQTIHPKNTLICNLKYKGFEP